MLLEGSAGWAGEGRQCLPAAPGGPSKRLFCRQLLEAQ